MLGRNLDFAAMLERRILFTLHGDGNGAPGLYQQILASQNWDGFSLAKGQIQGFEAVLNMMREVAQELNKEDEPFRVRAN